MGSERLAPKRRQLNMPHGLVSALSWSLAVLVDHFTLGTNSGNGVTTILSNGVVASALVPPSINAEHRLITFGVSLARRANSGRTFLPHVRRVSVPLTVSHLYHPPNVVVWTRVPGPNPSYCCKAVFFSGLLLTLLAYDLVWRHTTASVFRAPHQAYLWGSGSIYEKGLNGT